jgi:hypothetical protein
MRFEPFKNPVHPEDFPLVRAVGQSYICSGCEEPIPGGAWLYPTLNDDMVVGIVARDGGPDAPVVHKCGKAD